jgi:hypothetical protein
MSNSGMHIEKYGLGKPEPVNPVSPIVESLFKNELHDHAWKAYTKDKLIELIKAKVKENGLKLTERHYMLLKRKLDRCKNMEACLTVLTDFAFGKVSSSD